jgi:hypothetical protein
MSVRIDGSDHSGHHTQLFLVLMLQGYAILPTISPAVSSYNERRKSAERMSGPEATVRAKYAISASVTAPNRTAKIVCLIAGRRRFVLASAVSSFMIKHRP